MNTFKIESCHEVGIAWEIEAPPELSEDEIEALMEHICNWTDNPDSGTYKQALKDLDCFVENSCHDCILPERKPLYFQIKAFPQMVHREMFTQSFQKVD